MPIYDEINIPAILLQRQTLLYLIVYPTLPPNPMGYEYLI